MIKRGGIIFNKEANKFSIDWAATHSYIAAALQLDAVISASKYAKGKLLDVGCGNKPFLHVFNDKVESYTGIEVPSTLHMNNEIDIFSSGESIPFKDKSFDTILTSSVLEHVKEPQKMFNEMYRVLKKNSCLILTTPCQYGLHEQPHDYFRYTKYSLRLMAEKSGFKIVFIKPIGGMLVIVNQLIWKYFTIFLYALLERIKGNKLDREKGFRQIRKNMIIQLISFIPQKFFLVLYRLGLRKIDELSADVDPLMYIMVAKK